MEQSYVIFKPREKRLKLFISSVVLWFLGRAFQSVVSFDKGAREEVKSIPEGTIVMLKINPIGPMMTLEKKRDKFLYLGALEVNNPDIAIYFKNIEGAFLVLTGQLGIAQAYAEHRFTLNGDIFATMSIVRILYLVEAYLFPKFISSKILKEMPIRETGKLKIYITTILGIK